MQGGIKMNLMKVICIAVIFFSSVYSDEKKNINLTLEGFDDFHIGLGLHKNKFHGLIKLGLGFTRKYYQDAFHTNLLETHIGINLGKLKSINSDFRSTTFN